MSNKSFLKTISEWRIDVSTEHTRFVQIVVFFKPAKDVDRNSLHDLFQEFARALLLETSPITMDRLESTYDANFVFMAARTDPTSGVSILALIRNEKPLSQHSCLEITKNLAHMLTNISTDRGIVFNKLDFRHV